MPPPGTENQPNQPGEDPGGQTGEAPAGTPPDAGGASDSRLEKLEATLREQHEFIEQLKAENADHRETKRKLKDEDQKRRGEFEPMLAGRDQRIAELEAELESERATANRWREHQDSEGERIVEEAKTAELDAEALEDLAAIPDLVKRRRMLERLKGAKQQPTATPGGDELPPGGPGGPAGSKPIHLMSPEERAAFRGRTKNGSGDFGFFGR